MQGQISKLCFIAIATCLVGHADSVCERGKSWWDRQRGSCIPCTRCDPKRHEAVRVPCEVHRDTICQSIYEIDIWPFNTRKKQKEITQANIEDASSEQMSGDLSYEDYADYDAAQSGSDSVKWDVQMLTFIVAASGCLVFFVVVLTLTLYHSKQWKQLKKSLQSDVQDLSAKLKLVESGTEPAQQTIASTDHHIYCNIHVNKDVLIAPAGKHGFGNVYTEE